MKKILFFHGFYASGQCVPAVALREAFEAYVSCLHQLYLFGAAMQLNRMGYHMTKM